MANQNPPLSTQVTIVEASAGSGKTYCLAGRHIRLLMNGSLSKIKFAADERTFKRAVLKSGCNEDGNYDVE